MRCSKCGFASVTRSSKQNNTYWGLCIEPMAKEAGCSPMEMHEILKGDYLDKMIAVKTRTGVIMKRVHGSTTELSTKDFNDYMEWVKMVASTVYGVICQDPPQNDESGEYS